MERLMQDLEQWLHEQFPKSDVVLDISVLGGNFGGYLVWGGFRGKEPIDRQRQLSRALRDHFSQDEQRLISLIVTLTPAEYAVHCEPQMA
jgi:acid stress-induced BolA-like protein IbaG/YrbA